MKARNHETETSKKKPRKETTKKEKKIGFEVSWFRAEEGMPDDS
jgi:hypothetical protein